MNQQRPPLPATAPGGARPAAASAPALNVGFLLTDNFTLSAFSLFVDHLRLAADEGDRSRPILARWQVMSSSAEPVRASCGVTVSPTAPLTEPTAFHYIVVIGGLLHGGPQLDEATIGYLKRAARAGVPLVGICTGSFVLARAGLMTGRRCCVSWYHYQDFLDEFPHHTPVADRLYVIDGDRITCAGGGGAADLATALVEKHIGRAVAQKSRHVMMLDRVRPGSEAQPHPPIVDLVADDRVRRALILMEQHIADPLPIADIARRLQLSTRQLERLFQSVMGQRPAEFYRRIRLRYARFLLDTTARSVTDIALEAGFSDCAHFSRQFKALHGFTPSDARATSPAAAQTQAAQRLFE
ncbi:GlxA family transcriptional regulator [Ancylobacter lacus]|uniref:GlxA family transcriptional regulator n=1 Tax=Ancylobacter lacus TaxID=2579970 RepID=UPI001BCD8E90|nr:GlxA family transcriptional regulator [Ancylobacter lacus]MBS7540149.1 GlxA family transcriptional regulator [Ancylobacter lacus]